MFQPSVTTEWLIYNIHHRFGMTYLESSLRDYNENNPRILVSGWLPHSKGIMKVTSIRYWATILRFRTWSFANAISNSLETQKNTENQRHFVDQKKCKMSCINEKSGFSHVLQDYLRNSVTRNEAKRHGTAAWFDCVCSPASTLFMGHSITSSTF